MFKWLREYLEMKLEYDTKVKVCQSCETLKQQLEIANYEKRQLLDRLLLIPEKEPEKELAKITIPRAIPWRIRQQMLEAEDRERVRILRSAPKSTDELEKELEVATTKQQEAS